MAHRGIMKLNSSSFELPTVREDEIKNDSYKTIINKANKIYNKASENRDRYLIGDDRIDYETSVINELNRTIEYYRTARESQEGRREYSCLTAWMSGAQSLMLHTDKKASMREKSLKNMELLRNFFLERNGQFNNDKFDVEHLDDKNKELWIDSQKRIMDAGVSVTNYWFKQLKTSGIFQSVDSALDTSSRIENINLVIEYCKKLLAEGKNDISKLDSSVRRFIDCEAGFNVLFLSAFERFLVDVFSSFSCHLSALEADITCREEIPKSEESRELRELKRHYESLLKIYETVFESQLVAINSVLTRNNGNLPIICLSDKQEKIQSSQERSCLTSGIFKGRNSERDNDREEDDLMDCKDDLEERDAAQATQISHSYTG